MRLAIVWSCLILLAACTASRMDRAMAKADALRGTQQYEQSLRAYEALLIKYPQHPKCADVLLRIGDLYRFNLQRRPEAVQTYRRVTTDWPWQPAAMQAYLRLAELAEESEDFPGAIEAYEALVRYFPSYPDRDQIRHHIAILYLRQRLYPQAIVELKRLAEAPDVGAGMRATTLFDLAETYFLSGQFDKALRYYDLVIADFPESALAPRAMAQKAECYAEMGELGMAQQLEQQAQRMATERLEHDPDGDEVSDVPAAAAAAGPSQEITIETTGRKSVTVKAEVATTSGQRERGLMYRRELGEGAGMWFVFPATTQVSFWMRNTFVALDLIFVSERGEIVDTITNAKPLSNTPLTPRVAYRYVLEVPAGFVKKHLIGVGSRVRW